MWLHTSCFLEFNIPVSTPFLLMLRPRSGGQQWVAANNTCCHPASRRSSSPTHSATSASDWWHQPGCSPFGHRLTSNPPTRPTHAQGLLLLKCKHLPAHTLPFLLPSRYCESDRFTQLASAIVAGQTSGYDQCTAIVDYIHRTVQYTPGTGQEIISACEVHQAGHGVCRDLAHLGIACCRALSIPARMVVGYLERLQPMDLHAWFEVYVGNRWYTFDPTQFDLSGGRVAIAYGRDATDVAIYTQFGDPVELLSMHVTVERMSAAPG